MDFDESSPAHKIVLAFQGGISTAYYYESATRMEISSTNEGYQLAIDDCGCGKLSVFVVAVLL